MCPGYQFKYSHDRATPSFSSAKTGANKSININSSLNEKIKKSNSNNHNNNNSKSKASSSSSGSLQAEIRAWLVGVEQGAGQLRTRCSAPPRLGCTPLDTSSMAQQGVTYTGEVSNFLNIAQGVY